MLNFRNVLLLAVMRVRVRRLPFVLLFFRAVRTRNPFRPLYVYSLLLLLFCFFFSSPALRVSWRSRFIKFLSKKETHSVRPNERFHNVILCDNIVIVRETRSAPTDTIRPAGGVNTFRAFSSYRRTWRHFARTVSVYSEKKEKSTDF